MKIRDFNRDWEFHSDKSAEVQIVNLPHDAMIMENRDKSNPSGGACAYFDGGRRNAIVLPVRNSNSESAVFPPHTDVWTYPVTVFFSPCCIRCINGM